MATTTTNITLHGDEDYIDMELISSPKNREFEFQMTSTCNDKETATSSADELFFNGKLLPLHCTAATAAARITKEGFSRDHYYKMPFTAPCTNTTNTPLDSCNISPSESCRVSCELNPDDYFFQWSTELTQLSTFINNHPIKKPWSKKLKLIKHSVLGQKLKASKTYLKSLFSKSGCSDESSVDPNHNEESEKAEILPKESSLNKFSRMAKKRPFSYPTIGAIMKNSTDNEGSEDNVQRRSFSGAIKRHSPIKCLSSSNSSSDGSSSSSSFSFNSNCSHELQLLRRSSSATEIEVSIEAAIAHCKKSQQILDSRNSKEPGLSL